MKFGKTSIAVLVLTLSSASVAHASCLFGRAGASVATCPQSPAGALVAYDRLLDHVSVTLDRLASSVRNACVDGTQLLAQVDALEETIAAERAVNGDSIHITEIADAIENLSDQVDELIDTQMDPLSPKGQELRDLVAGLVQSGVEFLDLRLCQ